MSQSVFNYCVNIIGYRKQNQLYGAACAWATQVDYDKVVFLLGSQSDTGKAIEVGSYVGISSLAKNQIDLVNRFGDYHSLSYHKYEDVDFHVSGSAITITNAVTQLVVKILQVIHLPENADDSLFYGIIEKMEINDQQYLQLNDLKFE